MICWRFLAPKLAAGQVLAIPQPTQSGSVACQPASTYTGSTPNRGIGRPTDPVVEDILLLFIVVIYYLVVIIIIIIVIIVIIIVYIYRP